MLNLNVTEEGYTLWMRESVKTPGRDAINNSSNTARKQSKRPVAFRLVMYRSDGLQILRPNSSKQVETSDPMELPRRISYMAVGYLLRSSQTR
ncbi:hypothetical protein EGR_05601 [Echinococcus granulosus]|uniref:Uncharacterized protein n=1 Tax=Echinococcus granulosus TaxID=6210 RepID=W6V168_ECHGR|nr:hypothetical protein EGR_05601 [Echinococcus granulosus]EUB59574.1 hypothetical protein EGR_05601 [Echinococcus granulosus]